GYAFARTAVARGATVTLVAANVSLPDPAGVSVVPVETTEQLHDATLAAVPGADAVVMAAAPCDFRPTAYAPEKIAKPGAGSAGGELAVTLVPTVDVAAAVGAAKPAGQLLVAFAAETVTGDAALASARAKLARKHADLIVLNQVGDGAPGGFGADTNAATVLGADGSSTVLSPRGKDELADAVWDLLVSRLPVR
ncbi:MAG: phosphopantothenoylcysteine decarboxylase, partial [Natronosporangium sp.]